MIKIFKKNSSFKKDINFVLILNDFMYKLLLLL